MEQITKKVAMYYTVLQIKRTKQYFDLPKNYFVVINRYAKKLGVLVQHIKNLSVLDN